MKKLQGEDLLQYVLEVSQKLAATRELAPLLSYAVDEVLQLVGAERGFIVLETNDGRFDILIKRDKDGNELLADEDELSHSIIAEVLNTGEALLLRNAMIDPRFSGAMSVISLQLRSIMCVPLIAKNRTTGAIYVENRAIGGRFGEQDLIPLKLFANQAAVSIENATLNEQLQVANQSLRELDQMKNNFILLTSHELRTPLTTVSVYAQLFKQLAEQDDLQTFAQKSQKYANRLTESVERMQRTIQEIISVFRIMSGQVQVVLEPINIEMVMSKLVADWHDDLAKRDLTLTMADLTDLPLVVADRQMLRIVLENILSNAVKYVPDHGCIRISARVLQNQVELVVVDTGIGIPITEQGRIFDIFHVLGSLQTHSSSKSAFLGGGMGLGLPIAKGLVEAMKGSIRLESPGHDPESYPGTTCYITLPSA